MEVLPDRGSTRRPLRFLLLSAVLLLVFLSPWTAIDRIHTAVFRIGCEVVLSPLRGDYTFAITPPRAGSVPTEVVVMVGRSDVQAACSIDIDSRKTYWNPLGIFLALFLATRMSRGARWRGLLLGGLLVHLYVALRVVLVALSTQALFARNCPGDESGFFTSSGWTAFIESLSVTANNVPSIRTLVPAMIWAFVVIRIGCFRVEDLPLVLRRRMGGDSS